MPCIISVNKDEQVKITLHDKEKRALTITLIIGLLFGAYFLRHYISIIVVGGMLAYLFYPLRQRFNKKMHRPGVATLFTMLVAFLCLIIPILIIVLLTVLQINSLLKSLPTIHTSDITTLGTSVNNTINNMLASLPGSLKIDTASVVSSLQDFASKAAQAFLNFIISSIGSIPKIFTNLILFIFVFASFLTHGEELVKMFRKINPLGPKISDLYMQKMGDMTKAVIKGQFIIAFVQGFIGAASLYIVGWHNIFFFMWLILSAFSVVPLGSGIITIPIGIIMMILGDYWQGAFVILTHVVVVTNVDNFLRARLVPKGTRINPALMMLAVFSGIAMFGFIGIVIGPVLMILILSTVQVYLATVAEGESEAQIK